MGAMGEEAGKFFLNQMLEIIDYMHNEKATVHRDLKPENILVDNLLSIKFADFGFSTSNKPESSTSLSGSNTYTAPEVKALMKQAEADVKPYDGKKADLFSIGVLIFLLVKGTFPFLNADEEDFYYSKITSGDADTYFAWVDKDNTLSAEFKDLVWSLFSPKGTERPSIEEIRAHKWLKTSN
jgi:serine/threonine protein kinase